MVGFTDIRRSRRFRKQGSRGNQLSPYEYYACSWICHFQLHDSRKLWWGNGNAADNQFLLYRNLRESENVKKKSATAGKHHVRSLYTGCPAIEKHLGTCNILMQKFSRYLQLRIRGPRSDFRGALFKAETAERPARAVTARTHPQEARVDYRPVHTVESTVRYAGSFSRTTQLCVCVCIHACLSLIRTQLWRF